MVTSFAICSIFSWLLLVLPFFSITILFTAQLPRLTECLIQELLYCHLQLCNLLTQSHDVIFPFCLNWPHMDALPCMVFLLSLNLSGWCHKLKISYPSIITQIAHWISQLLMQPMERLIPQVLLHLTSTQPHQIFLPCDIQCPLVRLHIMLLLGLYPVAMYRNIASRYQRMPQCHIPALSYWLFLTLGPVDPGTRQSQLWLHINIVPFLPAMSPVWLCITLFKLSHRLTLL